MISFMSFEDESCSWVLDFFFLSRRWLGQLERKELQQSNLERTKADTSVFVVNRKKMSTCANTAEFRVGRSTDVLFVQFYAHAISGVKTKISGRRRKRDFKATDTDDSRFGDRKGLERWAKEESLCFIIIKVQFVFKHPGLAVWQILRIECSMERRRRGAEYRPQKTETQ